MKRAIFTLAALCILGLIVGFYICPPKKKNPFREKGQSPPTTHSKKSVSDFPQPTSPPLEAQPKPTPFSPPAPASPAFTIDDMAKPPGPTDIAVPRGARVPAVLMDGGGPDDSPETAAIINVIIEEFAAKIDEAKLANRNEEEAWEEAREVADDRYRQFFGFEAFNEATLEAAGEAYEESSAQNPPPVR
jgi:hypothetical protein